RPTIPPCSIRGVRGSVIQDAVHIWDSTESERLVPPPARLSSQYTVMVHVVALASSQLLIWPHTVVSVASPAPMVPFRLLIQSALSFATSDPPPLGVVHVLAML